MVIGLLKDTDGVISKPTLEEVKIFKEFVNSDNKFNEIEESLLDLAMEKHFNFYKDKFYQQALYEESQWLEYREEVFNRLEEKFKYQYGYKLIYADKTGQVTNALILWPLL